jgi:GntR family transcriptional regulator, histidine utilization repressor
MTMEKRPIPSREPSLRNEGPAGTGLSGLPLYQKVKQHILDCIEGGQWRAGQRIPSENMLVDSLGVSRMTVNRALRELAEEGILSRSQGVGTFVAEQKPLAGLLEVRSITDEILWAGGVHTCEVLLLAEKRATRKVALALGIKPGQRAFHSIIVHKNHDLPVQFAERWVNPSVAPDYLKQDFRSMTPHQYLQSVAHLQKAQHILEAVLPDRHVQEHLRIGPHEPCLLLLRRTWALGRVATDNRFTYPGSRYRMGCRFQTPYGELFESSFFDPR